ncbi:hypothetical protein [Burkholderia pyrrocinia]|uniref:hypothetical protein n=1 Tax=Burkholderia pyrrocinia TaxID=60550 RepID=UPI0010477221|nr:hypothetical protein [Burkholderia pyrrocinia]TDA44034.1 hypothetical protein EVG18_28710 [Burkholderia pyrrocinia]
MISTRLCKKINMAVGFSLFFACTYASGQYKYPVDNFLLTIRNPFNLQFIIGKHYEGDYHSNGWFCKTPKFAIQALKARLAGITTADLTAGEFTTAIDAAILGELREDRCRLGNFDFACTKRIDVAGPFGAETKIKIPCIVDWRNTPFSAEIDSNQTLKVPLQTPYPSTVQLPGTTSGSIDVSFAKKAGDDWVPMDAPQDKTLTLNVEGAAYFYPKLRADYSPPDPSHYQTLGDNLLAVAAFRHGFADTPLPAQAIIETLPVPPFDILDDPSFFASIRLREGLFADYDFPISPTRGYGILGSWFPLLISGKTKLKIGGDEHDVTLKVAIDAARARITISNGVPHISVELRVASVTLKVDQTQQELVTDPVQPFIELDGPTVSKDGHLHFNNAVVGFDLTGKDGNNRFQLPLGNILVDILNKSLPDLSTLQSTITTETPDCVTLERGTATRPCRDFGGATDGYFALNLNDGVVRKTTQIDWRATRIEAATGQIEIYIFTSANVAHQEHRKIRGSRK